MLLKNILFSTAAISSFLLAQVAHAEEETQHDRQKMSAQKEEQPIDLKETFIALGHLLAQNLASLDFIKPENIGDIIAGIQGSFNGKLSPMDEATCMQNIAHIQEQSFQELAAKNLKEADTFMAGNAKKEGIIELEKGMVQCKIEKSGDGPTVEKNFSPKIRYTGKFLNGETFGFSKEDEIVSLVETIPGFAKGIEGMKQGEKRTVYVHPSRGYGTNGYLAPNATLVFDVEVIETNATVEQDGAESAPSSNDEVVGEIASSSAS